jgi:hypothetical protein
MAASADEIRRLVDQADSALQGIQNALGPDGPGGRVRFPRGYLKTVHARIGHFAWIDDDTLKRNLCYHLIFSDVLRWLLNRTDLGGVARGMVIKHVIALMGSVVESLTLSAMRRLNQGKRNYAKRIEYLAQQGFIDHELRGELLWLWEARSGVHVFEVSDLELDTHELAHSNRAIRATRTLTEVLNARFLALEFDDLTVVA